MLTITKMFITNHNRPKKNIIRLKGIVLHWTANRVIGANAISNRNYFNTCKNACSAHYIVDDNNIIQSIPNNETVYHVGSNKYTQIGQELREDNFSPNFFTIGIEMCVNTDGTWEKTYGNTTLLVTHLLFTYNLPIQFLYRHYDITGKLCPHMFISENSWFKFKNDVKRSLLETRPDTENNFGENEFLTLNSISPKIELIQTKLNLLGYNPGKPDGILGYRTHSVLQHFQAEFNLNTTGIVDHLTWNKMFGGKTNDQVCFN